MDELAGVTPLVVLAPHPDDESIGCGGLLADIWRGGGQAHVLCLTDGAASHPQSRTHPPDRLRDVREAELLRAVECLGGKATDVTFMRFPDALTDRVHGPGQDAGRALAAALDRLEPACLLAPSPMDPHCDHVTAARTAREVARRRVAMRLFYYPIWSAWTEPDRKAPQPEDTQVILREHDRRALKRAAIDAHKSQTGRLITDDPDGFMLPPGFIHHFVNTPEVFFEVRQ